MTKHQSNQAFNTAAGQQSQNAANAQSSYNAAQGDIGDFKSQLANYAAQNPYVQGGQFQTSQNQQMADTAAAGSTAAQQAITGSMVRSGLNPTAAVAAGEQVAESNARGEMGSEAAANEARLSGLANYNTGVLSASAKPEEMEQGLASTEQQGENAALNTEESGSNKPSFWQELGQEAITGGGTLLANKFCPAEGSLYLMADGSEIKVELLSLGDKLLGIDGEPQTIEAIERAPAKVLRIETAGGLVLRCSRVHAFALPMGGFATAGKVKGKRILVERGDNLVSSVEPDGEATVYNVITDGSHTYRANGMWSLGVGEAERAVTMDEWNRIAEEVL